MSEQDILGLSYTSDYYTQKKTMEQIILDNSGITIGSSSFKNGVISIPYELPQFDVITTGTFPKPLNEKYVCPFCGTVYIATDGGFIPECKNCGGTMRLEE